MMDKLTQVKTSADVCREKGTGNIEYRRAYRREYRALVRRIDYLPDRKATEAIDRAIAEGHALNQSDAINRALRAWDFALSLAK